VRVWCVLCIKLWVGGGETAEKKSSSSVHAPKAVHYITCVSITKDQCAASPVCVSITKGWCAASPVCVSILKRERALSTCLCDHPKCFYRLQFVCP
jgi:hypothetical protein